MVKHPIDRFTIVEGVDLHNGTSSAQGTDNCAPVVRIDCYQGQARVLRACIHFCPDGCKLEAPQVDSNGVIHLYCNTCQYPSTRDLLRTTIQRDDPNGAAAFDEIYVYYNTVTDAGLHAGKDPFAQKSGGLSL